MLAAVNLLKAWAVALALVALLGGLGWLLDGLRAALISLFCGLLIVVAAYWYAERAIMGAIGARELPAADGSGLHSIVERLATQARVVKPRLYLADTGYPYALSAGRGATASGIAVSTGLTTMLRPAEIEGVLAHELAHARHRDVVTQSIAVLIASALIEFTRIGGWLQRPMLFVLGPVAAAVAHLLLSPRREFTADRAAAELCGSPHTVADALLALDRAGELVSFSASPATEPLYTVNPFAEEGLASLFTTHPPLEERVTRLRELDPGWRERLRAA